MYFPREEYEARWSRLHDEMQRRGYETAVIWQRTGEATTVPGTCGI